MKQMVKEAFKVKGKKHVLPLALVTLWFMARVLEVVDPEFGGVSLEKFSKMIETFFLKRIGGDRERLRKAFEHVDKQRRGFLEVEQLATFVQANGDLSDEELLEMMDGFGRYQKLVLMTVILLWMPFLQYQN